MPPYLRLDIGDFRGQYVGERVIGHRERVDRHRIGERVRGLSRIGQARNIIWAISSTTAFMDLQAGDDTRGEIVDDGPGRQQPECQGTRPVVHGIGPATANKAAIETKALRAHVNQGCGSRKRRRIAIPSFNAPTPHDKGIKLENNGTGKRSSKTTPRC